MGFFSVDGPIYKFFTRLWDLVKLNCLWLICSIPIVTMGAATVAAFSVTLKMVEEKEGYIAKAFFKEFRANLKKGIPLGLIFMVAIYSMYLDYQLFNAYAENENLSLAFLIAGIVVGFTLYLSLVYAFPLMARYDNSVIATIKNSHQISVKYFLRTLALLVVLAVEVLAFMWNGIMMLFGLIVGPVCIMLTISGFAMYAFRRLEKEPGAVSNPEKLDEL